MRVTSFKDVGIYLYTSAILPLKRLNLEELDFPSPLRGENGEVWTLSLERAAVPRRYRRNYQNMQANRRRDWHVILKVAHGQKYILASYNERNHWVKMYQEPFKVLGAMPLFGRLHHLFNTNTPFGKIVVEDAYMQPRPPRPRGDDRLEEPMYPYPTDEDEEYDDDDM
jgi:hypothetical protein